MTENDLKTEPFNYAVRQTYINITSYGQKWLVIVLKRGINKQTLKTLNPQYSTFLCAPKTIKYLISWMAKLA